MALQIDYTSLTMLVVINLEDSVEIVGWQTSALCVIPN
jgi:hypothetical protein